MKFEQLEPPRTFSVGIRDVRLQHVANVRLIPDEVVTFLNASDQEYDVTAKDWGYYLTPSVDARLRSFKMRAGIMRNRNSKRSYVVLVFDDKLSSWQEYLEAEDQELVTWLDELT